MKIQEIKDFIDNEVGFDIARSSSEFSHSQQIKEKVFSRWFFAYLTYQYATEYINNYKIADMLNVTPATVIHGLKEFENLAIYDKQESRGFRILEDRFIEKYNPPKKELLEVLSKDQLESIKNIKNLRKKISKINIEKQCLIQKLNRLKKVA